MQWILSTTFSPHPTHSTTRVKQIPLLVENLARTDVSLEQALTVMGQLCKKYPEKLDVSSLNDMVDSVQSNLTPVTCMMMRGMGFPEELLAMSMSVPALWKKHYIDVKEFAQPVADFPELASLDTEQDCVGIMGVMLTHAVGLQNMVTNVLKAQLFADQAFENRGPLCDTCLQKRARPEDEEEEDEVSEQKRCKSEPASGQEIGDPGKNTGD